ncbi:hypothetical protein CD175_13470 [Pseudomonas laurylsulfatiphila]|uniref:Uncharacterized protein n=1 Tax=Pseudomonas laurylsulfatiphila TaxID=2011015 RepID=A0A2S6FN01_9PSED|nr:hypothetical protein CD175_13470 [Pseudomonas laurylsulfatiphila]
MLGANYLEFEQIILNFVWVAKVRRIAFHNVKVKGYIDLAICEQSCAPFKEYKFSIDALVTTSAQIYFFVIAIQLIQGECCAFLVDDF